MCPWQLLTTTNIRVLGIFENAREIRYDEERQRLYHWQRFCSVVGVSEKLSLKPAGGTAMGDKGLYALGLGIMLGLAAFGATTGQGRVGASAMEGLARNPQARNSMFVPMIVVLVHRDVLGQQRFQAKSKFWSSRSATCWSPDFCLGDREHRLHGQVASVSIN